MGAKKTLNDIENLERVGVIGSPSSNSEITVDILESACKKNLVGSFTIFKFNQENAEHCALGQITGIELRNVWTEDSTMKGLIRRKGSVPPVTGRQDTHIADMLTSSVFKENKDSFEPGTLGTVPETGTPIKIVTDQILDGILEEHKKELFYLGRIYGSEPKLPTWFKHFSKGEGGLGEAYHIGIFGKTGSGKSYLAKMMTSAYAKHKEMSILIIDPQGEFTKDSKDKDAILNKIFVKKLGRTLKLYNLHNLILSGPDLLREVLIDSEIFFELGIRNLPNQEAAAKIIVTFLEKEQIPPYESYKRENFDKVCDHLSQDHTIKSIYTTDKGGQERIRTNLQNIDRAHLYAHWLRIMNLFAYRKDTQSTTIKKLVEDIFKDGEKDILVVDLSSRGVPDDILWNDDIKHTVINELLERLTAKAEEAYKEDKYLNSLVILDEAHKLAPRELPEDNERLGRIKNTLINAVRTTRKCGLGWMFISQTLASLDKEIIDQLRVFAFGFGLCWGRELLSLKDIIGGNDQAISLYQSFKDPQSGFKTREYPFMIQGPISPLSFTSTPMFMTALNFPEEFLEVNSLKENGNEQKEVKGVSL